MFCPFTKLACSADCELCGFVKNSDGSKAVGCSIMLGFQEINKLKVEVEKLNRKIKD